MNEITSSLTSSALYFNAVITVFTSTSGREKFIFKLIVAWRKMAKETITGWRKTYKIDIHCDLLS